MLRANQAVRLGLRAASRNAELSFAKGLINQGGNLLALLPIAFAAILIAALARGDALRSALLAARALAGLRWPVLGGIAAALSIALAASLLFWAGAVPLLAADAELNRRPPPGNFALLVSRGAARTVVAGILGWGISILFTLACDAAVIFAIPALLLRPPGCHRPRGRRGIRLARGGEEGRLRGPCRGRGGIDRARSPARAAAARRARRRGTAGRRDLIAAPAAGYLRKRRRLIFFTRPLSRVQLRAAPKSIAARDKPISAASGQTV